MDRIPFGHEANRFAYSDSELGEILARLGDPGVAQESEPPPEKEPILLLLESASRSCLRNALKFQFAADRDITISKQVVKASQKLLKQLRRRYSDGQPPINLLGEIAPHTQIQELADTLVHIVNSEKQLLRHTKFKHNRGFERSRNPAFYQFVGELIEIWSWWKREEPGGSKSGGPAARFVVSAANPVIAFAKSRMNLDLRSRREGPLDEFAAGELIANIKTLRRTNSESFIAAGNWYGG